jgi:hypothetical protein
MRNSEEIQLGSVKLLLGPLENISIIEKEMQRERIERQPNTSQPVELPPEIWTS